MTIHFSSVDQALRKAKTLSKAGAVGDAQAAYRWVLEKFPDNRRAREGLQALGAAPGGSSAGPGRDRINALIALHRQGRFAEAMRQAQALVALHPQAAFLHNLIGICHTALGEPGQAVARFERALKLAPEAADIHGNLGDALSALNRPQQAAACFARAVELNPAVARNHNNLGSALIRLGKLEAAAESYAHAAEADPVLVDAHANLGLALIKLGRIDEGAAACRRAIGIDPRFPLAHINLAHAHDAAGETEQAIRCLETAIGLKPDHVGAYSNLCEMLDRLNRVDALRAVLAQARERCSENDPRILFRSAQLAARDKDHATARELLERMPDEGLTAAIAKGRLTLLGKTCDKLGDHTAAFGWFERINAFVAASPEAQKWNPAGYRKEVEALIASFEGIDAKPWTDAPEPDTATPVFLVGFPRSGTTLLDTILRSHPGIAVVEEMPMVFRMRERLGGTADLERLQALSDADIAGLREIYRNELGKHVGEASPPSLVIDKLPLNIVHAGLIRRVFPSARFIFAQRHPCDCVLSCFMQNFKLNNPMANFLDIETGAILYDRAMRLWTIFRDALGLDVHTLVYEDLVADLEGVVTPLLGFLGLQWDERMRDYRETALARGRINTPSYNQVTENLYNRASGRWQGYREQMAPVLPLLEPWATRFGY
ncbi:MAG: sulfotransferase [Rhizobiaceae bacterium]